MAHSKTKIWIHAIFSTKNRQKLIGSDIRQKVFNELKKQLIDCGCFVDAVGGVEDHVHLLFLLNPQKSISEIMKQIKGSSSHTFNQQNLTNPKFAWQVGFGAFAVSESHVEKVRKYIQNQEEHHKKITFLDEYKQFMEHYGLTLEEPQ